MANTSKKAILRALIAGSIVEIMVKSSIENVVYSVGENGTEVTLADKLAEIVTDLGKKATATQLTEAINALRQEMLGDTPVEAYNTFTELAAYIAEHKEVADTLTEAIGKKANASTVAELQTALTNLQTAFEGLGDLASKDTVSEADLAESLREKINTASEGNHSHANKALLDTYNQTNDGIKDAVTKKHEHANKTVLDSITTEKVTKWDGSEQNAKDYADGLNTAMDTRVKTVEGKAHSHANKAVLDGITSGKVSAWDCKANIYYSAAQPANLSEGDLWVQLID